MAGAGFGKKNYRNLLLRLKKHPKTTAELYLDPLGGLPDRAVASPLAQPAPHFLNERG